MPILDENGNPRPDLGGGGSNNSPNSIVDTSKIQKKLLPSQYDGSRYRSNANMKPKWIVIHNVGPGSASACYNTFTDPNGRKVSTHFTCDDKEIIQMLECSWRGIHVEGNAMSAGGCKDWANGVAPAAPCSASNADSIGIEVGNNGGGVTSVDEAKALEVAIELTRYLMKELNIDADHVVRHGDCQPKNCPSSIMKDGGKYWVYFKEQIVSRNASGKPIELDVQNLTAQSGMGNDSGTTITTGTTLLDTPLYGTPTDIEVQLPDVDHRENTVNMDEVKGLSLMYYPPYNCCESYKADEHFKLFNWDRTYHYTIGKIDPNAAKAEATSEVNEDVSLFNTRSTSKHVAYIYDVKDGLCVLVRNGNTNILIDCGEKGEAVKIDAINHMKSLGIKKINHVILTHFHSDHVAGFKDFANNFEIENVYYKNLKKSLLPQLEIDWKTDKYYDEVVSICREKQINEIKITSDKTVDCVKIFAGDTSDNYNNYNRQSLSMTVTMNGKKLFVSGDIIYDTEKIILSKLGKCDALIIGHHGYASSNGKDFLDKIDADVYFVTTYTTDDDAHKEVIDRINNINTEFYSTHKNGPSILLDFDGSKLTHNAKTKVNGETNNGNSGETGEGDPVGGTKDLEFAKGFRITASVTEVRQSKGFADNDTHTYIDRALFQNKRQKHNLTLALMCPEPKKDPDTGEFLPDHPETPDYPTYEKALIEGLSIVLHEHALEVKDLWREFDLNRAPSPFLYLDRDDWKDFLSEVEKQLEWRKAKYGTYTKTFEKYTAGSSGLSGGSTGSISGGYINGSNPGTNPDAGIGDGTLDSDNEVVNTIYRTFTGLGLTPEAACGIIGNIFQESGFNPTIVNPKSGATGLCQWLNDRLTNLKKYAQSLGKDWSDVETQCKWAWEEANGKDACTKNLLTQKCGGPEGFAKLTDLKKAVDLWRTCFERCGEHEAMDARRYDAAKKYYDQIKKTGTGSDDSTNSSDPDDYPTDNGKSRIITPRANTIVFVGDSLTVGMSQAVSGITSYAKVGQTVWQGYDAYANQIVAAKPSTVVISYGTNDAGYNNVTKFVSSYKKFIKKLKDEIPNVKIYISKIFPGDASKSGVTSSGKACINGIPALNNKLAEIATEGATIIDSTNIPNLKTYYSNDGIHFNSSFYKLWYDDIMGKVGSGGGSTSNPVFGWPLPGIDKVSSKFGPRTPPCPGASSMHGGIDIGAASGTSIKAFAGGKVVQNVAWNKSAGNYIKIDHGNGVATRYLHMKQPSPLKVGAEVAAGQEVGLVGNTGVGTGAHLHFEIHINGEKVDPLEYVKPGGGTTGKLTELGDTGGSSGGGGGTTPGGVIGAPTDDLLYDDTQQGVTDAPIEGNSAGSTTHDDWGGKMVYKKGSPTNANAKRPEITTIITQEKFLEIMENARPELIEEYLSREDKPFEPYNKGLASVADAQVLPDDRISAMTKSFTTTNENTFHYKVIESGPGSIDHCVTVAEELNYLAIPEDLKVEPIYPDLVIPPGYVSTEVDKSSPNTLPIAIIEQGGEITSEHFTKQLSFDYDLLEGKKKESNKTYHPVNYADPYPYDDKISDLERHFPKVFIDEIEGQLYSCNHPGCPISQPMAKNFAMLSDAMLNQSKRMEKRLTKLENILSTVIRNQGRMGCRMNINCVYYGGHSTFNKYKCIRCLHDDRVHDGELVTIDQCLNCTRFEPILGQVYNILDDSGLNGSIILDDMQMSYTDLEGFRNLNDITHRSSKYFNAAVSAEDNCNKPEKDLSDLWRAADKQRAVDEIKKSDVDSASKQQLIDELKEEDYLFKMNWAETFFNSQEPDIKRYPNEGIVARQKAETEDGESSLEDEIAELDPEMDKDVIEELKEQIKIRDNIWVDTRDIADSVQVNKYSSENFFFEDFNKVRIGKYGIKFSSQYNYNGQDYNSVYSGSGGGGGNPGNTPSAFANQARDKIVEMAYKIYQECVDGTAWYHTPSPRTTDYNNPQYFNGKKAYDCTSLVSCCYRHAGLNSMCDKSCSGGTLVREIMKGGKMFPCNESTLKDAKPGDVLVYGPNKIDQAHCDANKFFATTHAMIYIGDGKIIHASSSKSGIKCEKLTTKLTNGRNVFCRPADLIAADEAAAKQPSSSGGSGVDETSGVIDGKNYVAKIPQAVVTAYTGSGAGASGMGCVYNSTCASHNMPYGTKIYIPGLAGKAGSGVFTVTDTGGCFFDFDIFTATWAGKENMDAYVLEWGTGKTAASYTWAIDFYLGNGRWSGLIKPWNTYKNMNGKLMHFTKFNNEDATIKSHAHYND